MTLNAKSQLNDQLPSLVEPLMLSLEAFHATLLLESHTLKSGLPKQISEILQTKQLQFEEISLATKKLESTLSENNVTMTELLSSVRNTQLSSDTQTLLTQFMQLSESCHDLNLANGMSINMLSNINQHALNLMSGKPTSNIKLYGSSGETQQNSSNPKNTLGKA